ncbi:hypothetical protein J1N35_043693 [Gossypium stocksii]|uniref:O-fucosyltransferase family protein n=1 Tax=Gossypium stocksii TaxID=47602 RepID=A0A9D3ZF99_9ROSI|nr:hypothetical protein J1N35_043693 [Gossypium stocksii]
MDKIERLVVSKSPGCDRFRLWMVGITTTMLLQWVLSSQSGDDTGTITAKVEAPPYFPPPRDYENQGYLMVSCYGGLNQMRADVFPRFQKYEVVRFAKTDSRLGNNLAVEVQKIRCRVNYEALRFTPAIEVVGKKALS